MHGKKMEVPVDKGQNHSMAVRDPPPRSREEEPSFNEQCVN